MGVAGSGAVLFGVLIGWITYRTLVRREGPAALSDIATVIGALGGGAVLAIFDNERLFGFYSIGLAIGFFGYLVVLWIADHAFAIANMMRGPKEDRAKDE
jgi:uncharacterized membrane protein YeaQ/YmgE (transglycosylase-associated protein family)